MGHLGLTDLAAFVVFCATIVAVARIFKGD